MRRPRSRTPARVERRAAARGRIRRDRPWMGFRARDALGRPCDARRHDVRRELGFGIEDVAFGWVGRLDRKKRVEDFVRAAALLQTREPRARFVVIGGADAFMPEYEPELHRLAEDLG